MRRVAGQLAVGTFRAGAILAALAVWSWSLAAHAACSLEPGEAHDVASVIDSETLKLDDGREVRLIGALAPQPPGGAAAGGWPPALAARETLEGLVGSRGVVLRTEGRRQDRYGRVLAQVFAADPANGANPANGGVWLQQAMVRAGQARAYTLPGNGACLGDLMAAEDEARRAGRGLWAREAYRLRAASDIAGLLRAVGQFVLVEGRVVDVGRSGRTIYLNFSNDWRHDFTASLARSRVDAATGGAARARRWRGGWFACAAGSSGATGR